MSIITEWAYPEDKKYTKKREEELRAKIRELLVQLCKADTWEGLERGSKFVVGSIFDGYTEEIMLRVKTYCKFKDNRFKPKP